MNYEKEKTPGEVIKYRAREDGEDAKGMVSRTLKSDMEKVYNHLKDKYGYDAGSYTNFLPTRRTPSCWPASTGTSRTAIA